MLSPLPQAKPERVGWAGESLEAPPFPDGHSWVHPRPLLPGSPGQGVASQAQRLLGAKSNRPPPTFLAWAGQQARGHPWLGWRTPGALRATAGRGAGGDRCGAGGTRGAGRGRQCGASITWVSVKRTGEGGKEEKGRIWAQWAPGRGGPSSVGRGGPSLVGVSSLASRLGLGRSRSLAAGRDLSRGIGHGPDSSPGQPAEARRGQRPTP